MTRYVAVLFFLFAVPAHAAEPFSQAGTYYISFTGLPVGKIWVSVQFDGKQCHAQAVLKTSGLVSMFDDVKSHTVASALYEEGRWKPKYFHKREDDGEKIDVVELDFAPDGSLTKRALSHEDDPNWRPPVPAAEVKGAWHLGMALCGLSDRLNQHAQGAVEHYRLYDGKRHYKVRNERVGERIFRLSRELLNGFTPKETKRFAEDGEPPIELTHISGDVLPQKLSVPLTIGTVSAVFEPER